MKSTWIICLLIGCMAHLESNAQGSENRGAAADLPIVSPTGKVYALVVGVSDYESSMINDLKYAAADARSLVEYLNSAPINLGMPVIELYDKNATRTNIREKGVLKIDNLISDKTIKPDDIVLIYLSGHGGVFTKDDSFFFPHDAAHMTDAGTSFSIKGIKGFIRRWASESKATVVFIFDACRSATVVTGQTEMDLDIVSRFLEEETGEILMAATRGGKPAQETKELMHGVFSFYLLEGLYGKADISSDNQISINELEKYVNDNVTSKTKLKQSPMVKYPPSMDGKIITLVTPELLAKVDQNLKLDLSDLKTDASALKVGGDKPISIELKQLIEKFNLAIKQNRLIKPADNCAYDYYQKMTKVASASTLQEHLTDLNIALYNAALNTVKQDLHGERAYLKPAPLLADSVMSIKDKLRNGYDLNYYKDASLCMKAYIDLKLNKVEPGVTAIFEYLVGRDLTVQAEQNNFTDAAKLQSAISSLKKSTEVYGDQAFIWQGLAMAYLGNKNIDLVKAKEAASNAVKFAPQWSYPLVSLATCAFQEGNKEQGYAYLKSATELNKLDFIGYQMLGNFLAANDKKEEAVIQYEKVIQLNPYYAYAYVRLASILTQLNRSDEAILQYQKVIKLHPLYFKAYAEFAWLLTKLGRYEEAIIEFNKAIELVPGNAEAHFNLGWALYRLNRKSEAIGEFEKAIQLDPSPTIYHDIMADCLHDLGRHNDAITVYKRSIQMESKAYPIFGLGTCLEGLGRNEDALVQYQKAIQLEPNGAYAYRALGDVLSKLGQYEGAIEQYKKAIQVKPDYAFAYTSLGSILSKLGRNEEALVQYQKAIQIEPNDAYAYRALGGLLSDLDRNEEAVNHYRKAIQLKPDQEYSYAALGRVLSKLGRNEEAIAQYQKAIQLKPDYAYAHYLLGGILSKLGRNEEALIQYQKAIQIDPNDASNYTSLGGILSKLGRNEEALAQYQKAIQLEPNNAMNYLILGAIQYQLGRKQEAILQFKKAIELDPNSRDAHYYLGEVFRDLKRNEEAVAEYQKTIQIDPNNADAHYGLGLSLYALDKKQEALASFEKTVSLNKDHRNGYFISGLLLLELGITEKTSNRESKSFEYFQKAEKLYIQFITKIPTDPEGYYGYASVLALTNRPTEALGQLKNAFEKGYNDWAALAEDENLVAIRNLAEFQNLVSKYKK